MLQLNCPAIVRVAVVLVYRGLSVTRTARPILASALILLLAAITFMGCSGSREDVRVTLCKDMVAVRIGSSQSITWPETETQTRGYEDAAVKLRYAARGQGGEAVCYFKYDAMEHTAQNLSDPLSAYSTSPYEMTLDGETLSSSTLARTIKDAMEKQGGELVDRLKKGLQ